MKYTELTILLPCHTLDDFPTHLSSDEAENFLSYWSSLWHPTLIVSAGKMPTWDRAEDPPTSLSGKLVLAPKVSEPLLPEGYFRRAMDEDTCVIWSEVEREAHDRVGIAALAIGRLEDRPPAPSTELVEDFMALGFTYFMVELLTRQMRYVSNIDLVHLENHVLAAAIACAEQDEAEAKENLQKCFDVLAQARDQFYPVGAYLVDLTLTASTTLGEPLKRELDSQVPLNVLLSGELLELMSREHLETFASLQSALERESVSLVGGEQTEARLPLFPIGLLESHLRRGIESYEKILGKRPVVFGRRKFGLTPMLPAVLQRSGFEAAMHVTLDDGTFPESGQSKDRWEGLDGSSIDALFRIPLDASDPSVFLRYPQLMGTAMDYDHVATLSFAHWPGRGCTWYEDLRRITKYNPVLGEFVSLESYFRDTDLPGQLSRYGADKYTSPYLRQDVSAGVANPISSLQNLHALYAQHEQFKTIVALQAMLTGKLGNASGAEGELAERFGRYAEDYQHQDSTELGANLEELLSNAGTSLAQWISGSCQENAPGVLVLNPFSSTQRIRFRTGTTPRVAEVPPLGFRWIDTTQAPHGGSSGPPLAESTESGYILRNQFFEVLINPVQGNIAAIRHHNRRGNRLSQQIAVRFPASKNQPSDSWHDPDMDAEYSVMAADSIEVISSGPVLGEIESCGRLLNNEAKVFARFRQKTEVWFSSRVIVIDLYLDDIEPLDQRAKKNPWDCYLASRFAWSDPGATVRRSVSCTSQATDASRMESPQWVDIIDDRGTVSILTCGLPYHHLMGMRMLDSLLVTPGETSRHFRFGIGIDIAHPLHESLALMTRPLVVEHCEKPAAGKSASFFQLSARNVSLFDWQVVQSKQDSSEENQTSAGSVIGFRAKLIETQGAAGRITLRSLRPCKLVRQIDCLGNTLVELPIEEDKITIDLAAYELVEIEGVW